MPQPNQTSNAVSIALKLLRLDILQHLPLIEETFPNIRLLKRDHSRRHARGYRKWAELQLQAVAEMRGFLCREPAPLATSSAGHSGSLVSLADDCQEYFALKESKEAATSEP